MITSIKTEGLEIGFDFDIALEPDRQVYCFIGKNGIGKTQLLEIMAKSLILRHTAFKPFDNTHHCAGFFSQDTVYKRLGTLVLRVVGKVEINGVNVKGKGDQSWGITSLEQIPSIEHTDLSCDKPIVFIGAKNRGFTKNIDTNNIKILGDTPSRFADSFERTLRYINSEGLEHEEVADWFASRLIINPNFVVKNQNKELEAVTVLDLIDRLEPGLDLVTRNESGAVSLKLMFSEGKLLVNNIPLDKLSTGYISVIKIFQEIIAGYSGWTNAANLNEVEGIVFIDELEPHLHISWQTRIIAILREFFPKTTFYISTHSPLVLAGLKNGEGYELVREGDAVKAKAIDNIENYFLNDIVHEFFGVDLNQEKIAHVDKAKQKRAKALLLSLAETLQKEER